MSDATINLFKFTGGTKRVAANDQGLPKAVELIVFSGRAALLI
jgi:hypothetical protein